MSLPCADWGTGFAFTVPAKKLGQDHLAFTSPTAHSFHPFSVFRGVVLEALGRFDEAVVDYRAVLVGASATEIMSCLVVTDVRT